MEEYGHLQLAEVCSNTEPEAASECHEVPWSTVYLRFILYVSILRNIFARYAHYLALMYLTKMDSFYKP